MTHALWCPSSVPPNRRATARALAILMSAYPKATNRELRNALRAGSSNLALGGRPPYHPETGFGLLQIQTALTLLPLIKFHPFYPLFP